MFGGFINQSYFLQAVGWGILHSFWQTGMLWFLFKLVTTGNQKIPASFRYSLGLFCLSASLLFFILTAVNQYAALENGSVSAISFFVFNREVLPFLSQGILQAISTVYLLLLIFHVLQFGRQYLSVYNFRNADLIKVPVEIRLFTQQAAYRIGIKKEVSCWLSYKADSPFVTGFFKPVILLPFSLLNHLTAAQAEAVILHELAHVKRNDYLVNIFQLVAEKLLFFNPFARLLSNAVRVEREHCCDDSVIQFKFNQHEYAQALLQVEQLRNQQLLLAMNATSGKKKLLERIKRIFSAEPTIEISGGQKIKLVTLLAGMLVALVLLVPVTKNELFTLSPVSVASIYNSSADVASVEKEQLFLVEPLSEVVATQKQNTVLSPIKEEPVQIQESPVEIAEEDPASTIVINEDLVEPPAESVATAIGLTEQTGLKSQVMVRVEEEVSGSKQKKVYYVQLSNTNGHTEVKPLAIVKQSIADSLNNRAGTANQVQINSKKNLLKKAI